MRKNRKICLKLDFFGAGTAIAGGAQAAGNVAGAVITANATKEAAQKSYDAAIATNNANIEMVDRTNAANLQLSQQQNQWNLEQWQRQNEYNSPAHQMALYKQAGLNPVLAQGNFTPAQELTSAPLANQVAPQISNPMLGSAEIMAQGGVQSGSMVANAFKSAAETAKSIAELKKVQAETRQVETFTPLEAKLKSEEIINLTKQNDWFDKKSYAEIDKLIADAKVLRNTIPVLKANKDKVISETALNRIEEGFKVKFNQLLLSKTDKEIANLIADLGLKRSQTSSNYASARKSNADAAIAEWEKANNQRLPEPKSASDKLLMWLWGYFTEDGTLTPEQTMQKVKNLLTPDAMNKIGEIMNDLHSTPYTPNYTAPMP